RLPWTEIHHPPAAPEQPAHAHAHLGENHLPQARDHDRGLHDFCAPGPCGGGVTITSTSIGSLPSLKSPCSMPASATSASPFPSRSSLPPTEKRPLPSRTEQILSWSPCVWGRCDWPGATQ